jgi:tRNA(His) guanylyltransferase
MKDALGDRMKRQYEDRVRYYLPRRTYTIVRLDGKSFHRFTKSMNKPFDEHLMKIMDLTALYLAKNVQGCKLAYTQSDEISLILTDFDNIGTEAWYNGNIQKMCSVSASMATKEFNRLWVEYILSQKLENAYEVQDNLILLAEFDSRVFIIPDWVEVINYLIWRQKDATRNSINMVAQSLYSHKELQDKNCNQMQEMIFQKNINWNDYTAREKRGGLIIKDISNVRNKWVITECPIFTEDKFWDEVYHLIPKLKD